MVDFTWKDEEVQKMVRDARDEELHGATNQGRVHVVISNHARKIPYVQITPAQARALARGRWAETPPLVWLAQTTAVVAVLEARTAVETEEILSTWLEHGDLITVARRLSAPVRWRRRPERGWRRKKLILSWNAEGADILVIAVLLHGLDKGLN
jgi:hypothetical protein